ncbi:MAG: threonine-phosphate decarboxylase [Desulfotignum sp.]
MIIGHGGNKTALARELGCHENEIVDMSANINPLGPPKRIIQVILDHVSAIQQLPEPDARSMVQGFARYHGIDPGTVIAGNGTTWFIYTLPLALQAQHVLILGPTYSDYADACRMHDIEPEFWIAPPETGFVPDLESVSNKAAHADLVFVCNPNNPTGVLLDPAVIITLLQRHPRTCFVVDESYLPFVADGDDRSLVHAGEYANLLVLSSMSKIFAIPGLRTGFLSGATGLIEKVRSYSQPWNVNALAQAVIHDIYDHPEQIVPFYKKTRAFIAREKHWFLKEQADIPGLVPVAGHTGFVLARLQYHTAPQVCRRVGQDRILIRDCTNFHGLNHRFVRFSLKDRENNRKLGASLKKALSQ